MGEEVDGFGRCLVSILRGCLGHLRNKSSLVSVF